MSATSDSDHPTFLATIQRGWSWSGAVALIVAINVSCGWTATLLIATLSDQQISAEGLALLDSLGSGLLTIVAGWIGLKAGERTGISRGQAMSRGEQEEA